MLYPFLNFENSAFVLTKEKTDSSIRAPVYPTVQEKMSAELEDIQRQVGGWPIPDNYFIHNGPMHASLRGRGIRGRISLY